MRIDASLDLLRSLQRKNQQYLSTLETLAAKIDLQLEKANQELNSLRQLDEQVPLPRKQQRFQPEAPRIHNISFYRYEHQSQQPQSTEYQQILECLNNPKKKNTVIQLCRNHRLSKLREAASEDELRVDLSIQMVLERLHEHLLAPDKQAADRPPVEKQDVIQLCVRWAPRENINWLTLYQHVERLLIQNNIVVTGLSALGNPTLRTATLASEALSS